MIDLYTAATSNGLRASVMLEETGLAYRAHTLDLAKGDQKKPEFLALNPFGQIPVIVDAEGPGGRTVLAQSGAILMYLAEKSGRMLAASGPARLRTLEAYAAVLTDVGPALGAWLLTQRALGDKAKEAVGFLEQRLVSALRACDARLAKNQFLAGEFSIADVALYPVTARAPQLIQDTPGLDNFRNWIARMAARPGVARGMQVGA
jgi:GST-like protein